MNKCIIVGHLTKDWELKTTPNGKEVANGSIATNKSYKNAQGEKIEETQFHNLVVWGKLAGVLSQYTKKGHKVLVEGELQTRDWEKDGVKHYRTEIVVNNFEFLEKKQSNNEEEVNPETPVEEECPF